MAYQMRNALRLWAIIFFLFPAGCTSLRLTEPTLTEGPMPLLDEDVLWVSSVPLGASVVVFEKDKGDTGKPDSGVWMSGTYEVLEQHRSGPFARVAAGATPLTLQLPPGAYRVGVQIDLADEMPSWDFCNTATLFGTMKSAEIYSHLDSGSIGDEGLGFTLADNNLQEWVLCDSDTVRKIGKIYEVEKKKGETATVIAVFQRKDENPDRIYETLPDGYRFRDRFMSPEGLEIFGIPKSESKAMFRRLMRGGKVLYSDGDFHFKCELNPLGRRPEGGIAGGFTISWTGVPPE